MKKQNFNINSKESKTLEDIKSDFITVASHQLRTPISAVRWSLDTLLSGRSGELTKKQKEVVKEAYQNNKYMVKVVNDLLRVARIEERGVKLNPKPTNIKALITENLKKNKIFYQACNCTVSFSSDLVLPKAYVDPVQIKIVIDGLIDNAIRYTNGKGIIKISLKKRKKYLVFKVKDNGIGIPTNQQSLVFSKFFRAENAMKTQTEGLGLDLYLIKKIVDSSGGKINFISQKNKNTIFSVYLPLKKGLSSDSEINNKREQDDILKKEREFVAITIHELKAPLGMTKWSLEMLKNKKTGQLSKDQIKLINQVYRGNERLLVLVKDLLNLAKIQEGKFDMEPMKISIMNILDDIVDGFKPTIKNKGLKIKWKKSKNKFPEVLADSNRIAQVFTNIISNAIKYTPKGGQITINFKKATGQDLKKINGQVKTANIEYNENKKGYLVISVKDSGIGISEEDKEKMFTRFFRSKKLLKTGVEGTGLGLYITKSIINLHHGDIWFTSELGKGSTFYCSLPIA